MHVLEESEGLISEREAARIIGVSRQAITAFIRRGMLSTVHVAGWPLLRKAEVWDYAQNRAFSRSCGPGYFFGLARSDFNSTSRP